MATTTPDRVGVSGLVRVAAGVAGLLSAAIALGVTELVAATADAAPSPVTAVAGEVIDRVPAGVREWAINTFGTSDKEALRIGIYVILTAAAVLLGLAARRRPAWGVAGFALFTVIGVAAEWARPGAQWWWTIAPVPGGAVGAVALVLLVRALGRPVPRYPLDADAAVSVAPLARDRPGEPPVPAAEPSASAWPAEPGVRAAPLPLATGLDRRRFVLSGVGVAALAAGTAASGRYLRTRQEVRTSRAGVDLPVPSEAAAPVGSASTAATAVDPGVPGLSPYRTPNGDFYRIDTAFVTPQVRAEDWRLQVHGMVERELELTFDDLLARPLLERDVTLACVSNEVGGPLVGNARWVGVALADVLREAGPLPGADQIKSMSADGWTCGTPLATVLDGRDALLAVGMNGEALPVAHGFPVRMVVPGLYGYVSATKWVVDLELTTFAAFDAYWVERGWAEQAPVKTQSRIDTPTKGAELVAAQVPVAGVAWAQHRGIAAVEVRVDEGAWQGARLADEPTVDAWRQWVWVWDAVPGRHRLEVRATDGTDAVQTGERQGSVPDGATGWHGVNVTVRAG